MLLFGDDPQLSEALAEDPDGLKDMADPAIQGTFAVDSLSKVAEIALNCTAGDPSDRPSIDDVIWNLQYSMQVQDGWASSESLGLSVKSQGWKEEGEIEKAAMLLLPIQWLQWSYMHHQSASGFVVQEGSFGVLYVQKWIFIPLDIYVLQLDVKLALWQSMPWEHVFIVD